MKRRDLLKRFENKGWWKERDRGNHTIYTNGKEMEAIPRHREINERLAIALIRKHKL